MRLWRLLVPAVALVTGLLLAASAHTAMGTDLRSGRQRQLQQLIAERSAAVARENAQVAALQAALDASTRAAAARDGTVKAANDAVGALAGPAGLGSVRGPSLTVVLDDAPRSPDGSLPKGATPDDLVVHQQDVQAAVNALWAGGAEAMTIMGQRLIATSAVRCVGNTLLLGGRVYSPPFTITAIGDPVRMRAALDREPGIAIFREYVAAYGLGLRITDSGQVTLPPYRGSIALEHAAPAASPSPAPSRSQSQRPSPGSGASAAAGPP